MIIKIDFGDAKRVETDLNPLRFSLPISEDRSSGSFSNMFNRNADRFENSRLKGTFVGTPLYVAPEMLELNQAGTYTDLWALGCIIFEMLNGKSPFYAKNSN